MNKTRNEGFTLVELLAVIVILAVVILIAVTAVVPRMNNAKKKAFLDEALVYMKAAKEAYVTDPSTECYNISDMENLVKQTKDGYSGTVFVNEKGVSLNLTNGKYYIKTNKTPNEVDIVETTPDKYVSTCSDNTNYTITYELNGGTVSGTNPSSYTPATGTNIFYNPTKSGYRFVGWSSKNLINLNTVSKDGATTDGHTLYLDKSSTAGNRATFVVYQKYLSSTYKGDIYSKKVGNINLGARESATFTKDDTYDRTTFRLNTSKSDPQITIWIPMVSGNQYTFSFRVVDEEFSRARAVIRDVQLEEGSTATDYQEFMEPTMNVKVYKGETGNKKFIANWEAI